MIYIGHFHVFGFFDYLKKMKVYNKHSTINIFEISIKKFIGNLVEIIDSDWLKLRVINKNGNFYQMLRISQFLIFSKIV